IEGDLLLAHRKVFPDTGEDLVEHAHRSQTNHAVRPLRTPPQAAVPSGIPGRLRTTVKASMRTTVVAIAHLGTCTDGSSRHAERIHKTHAITAAGSTNSTVIALKSRAPVRLPCMSSWVARRLPQNGQSSPVSTFVGHGRKCPGSEGSNAN